MEQSSGGAIRRGGINRWEDGFLRLSDNDRQPDDRLSGPLAVLRAWEMGRAARRRGKPEEEELRGMSYRERSAFWQGYEEG